jgi:hypothetical protein
MPQVTYGSERAKVLNSTFFYIYTILPHTLQLSPSRGRFGEACDDDRCKMDFR